MLAHASYGASEMSKGCQWHKVYIGTARAGYAYKEGFYAYGFSLEYREGQRGGLGTPRIRAGCRWFTFREARAHWKIPKDRPFLSPDADAKYNERALRIVGMAELRWLRIRAEHARKRKKKTRRRK